MRQVFYRGVKEPHEPGPGQVWVEESRAGENGLPSEGMTVRPLAPRDDLYECRAAFDWGFYGRTSARLSVAILADATGNDRLALALYAEFTRRFVAGWRERWRISAAAVRLWVDQQAGSLADEPVDEGAEEALLQAGEPAPYRER